MSNAYKKDLAEFSVEESGLVVDLKDFEFGDIIGKGGFGEVRRAIHRSTGRDVAVKQIFSERLEGSRLRRYIGEIKTMSKCNNMFLVPFVGFTASPPYTIVTEYMSNGALDNYTRNKNSVKLNGTQLTAIAIGISYGMIHLHSLNIIHRDLKAANILLDSRLFPRICDFGIARFEDQGSGMTAKIGTPNYMAPELITSKDYGKKVDVYAYAMILYEMLENQRPFKGMSLKQIFHQVVENNERPQFTKRGPIALINLIKRCWDRDPDCRPSFEEIFDEFKSHKVAFHDTVKNEIDKLFVAIKKSEKKRNVVNNGKVPVKSPVYSVKSASEKKKRTKNKGNDSSDYDSDPKKKKKSSSKGVKYVQEADVESDSDSSSTSDHADDVLRNPSNPLFYRYLDYYAKTIEPSQFNPFYSPISIHIKQNTPGHVINAVLGACYHLMQRVNSFIHLFAATKFFTNLPVKNADALDKIVDCYSMLFVEYPKALGPQHCNLLNVLLEKRPEKMLILHSYYVKQLLHLSNPWPILDNLFGAQRTLLNGGNGYLYLSLFYFLITKYQVYASQRSVHVRSVFLLYLKAKDPKTLRFAYNGLSSLYDKFVGLDFSLVTRHLNDDRIWDSCLSLLIRINKIIPSKELLTALLNRSGDSPKIWIVILNMSSSKRGCEFLLKNTNWMDYSSKHPVEVARVFLNIFKEQIYRERSIDLPEFPNLLKALILTSDHHMHSTVTSIIRRSPQSVDLLSKLHTSGVLKTFIKETVKCGTAKHYTNALAVFDPLSRIGYTPSFLLFTQHLVDLLSSNEHAPDAITVIVSMSYHKDCAIDFKKKDLVQYFKSLEKIDSYAPAAKAFLKNVEKSEHRGAR